MFLRENNEIFTPCEMLMKSFLMVPSKMKCLGCYAVNLKEIYPG